MPEESLEPLSDLDLGELSGEFRDAEQLYGDIKGELGPQERRTYHRFLKRVAGEIVYRTVISDAFSDWSGGENEGVPFEELVGNRLKEYGLEPPAIQSSTPAS